MVDGRRAGLLRERLSECKRTGVELFFRRFLAARVQNATVTFLGRSLVSYMSVTSLGLPVAQSTRRMMQPVAANAAVQLYCNSLLLTQSERFVTTSRTKIKVFSSRGTCEIKMDYQENIAKMTALQLKPRCNCVEPLTPTLEAQKDTLRDAVLFFRGLYSQKYRWVIDGAIQLSLPIRVRNALIHNAEQMRIFCNSIVRKFNSEARH
jgi:hypothetical protein